MASSSSSSTSQPWKYDVFLSFRGEDTRKTFVGHLYDALDRNGIYTYKDDITLPRGETIAPALLTAIEESRFAVLVFSNKYADSSWCLDELVKIMKCKKERGQKVLPVFYDVDPSDVRKQKGGFGEAFSQKESDSRSGVWRDALMEAANISGWEPKNTASGDESKCIKEIVETISLGLPHIISRVDEDLVAIEPRMQEVISLLEAGSGGVRMIGIWGIGGGGKTTVASAVYRKISHDFDGCSFVENIREDSIKFGLKTKQEKVLSDVLKNKEMILSGVEDGKSKISNRLSRKNVLLILDDVDHISHLEALAGSCNWFGEGSRIIITTRDEHLLKAHNVNAIYNVNLLEDKEAIQLFSRYAFRANRPIKEFEELSQSVVAYAGGLPLALKVLGSFLCDKEENEWVSALARLKDIPDSGILGKLKISFDDLEADEKEIFLDIACFYRGVEKDDVMPILDACGFHPVRGVRVLVQKSLITISDGKYGSRFDMHDLIQEMGHNIVQGKHPNNPEKHSRVWQPEKVLQICTRDAAKGNHAIEALKYKGDWPSHFRKALANMKNLRLLDVWLYDRDRFQSTKIKALPNGLRWITWSYYPNTSLPTTFEAQKLGGLQLPDSSLKKLWNGYKHLPNLKVLNLYSSSYLKSTPDFSGLPNLETLNLSGSDLRSTPDFSGLPNLKTLSLNACYNLVEIHPSLGSLERLVSLHLPHCFHLKKFPPIVKMRSLKTLDLDECHDLGKFPEILGNMDSLTRLSMHRCNQIEVVPSSIVEYMPNLVTIYISGCRKLKSFEGSFGLLKQLKSVKLSKCRSLEKLSEDLHLTGRSPSLELRHFPSSSMLRKLELSCGKLEDGKVPVDIGELSNLIELDLHENGFSRLPCGISRLTRLKFLNVSACEKLEELPMLPSSIAILKADRCTSLGRVADLPTECDWLCYFSLTDCSKSWKDKHRASFAERVLQSMLQGNAIASHGFSIRLPGFQVPKGFVPFLVKGNTSTLELPSNWYDKYSGFAVCGVFKCMYKHDSFFIDIMNETLPEYKMELDIVYEDYTSTGDDDDDRHIWLGYVSFSSFKFTEWLKSGSTTLTFRGHLRNYLVRFGVGLVDKKRGGEQKREVQITRAVCSSGFGDRELIRYGHDGKRIICGLEVSPFPDGQIKPPSNPVYVECSPSVRTMMFGTC